MSKELKDRRNELAKEVFGHGGVGYSIMEPYVQRFIDKHIALEDEVEKLTRLLKNAHNYIQKIDDGTEEGWS